LVKAVKFGEKALKAGKVAINPIKVGKKFHKFMAFHIFLQFGPIITDFLNQFTSFY
jgi:hypothetical protein